MSASFLRQELQSLNQYHHILLVGHSMGGLVARFAAEEYFDLQRLRAASSVLPLAGLLVVASPIGGALRFGLPFPDLRFLSKRNPRLKQGAQFRARHLDIELRECPGLDKWSFPIFSLSATMDRWVSRLNSGMGVPAHQREIIGGSHTEVVKPPSREHKSVQYLLRVVDNILAMRASSGPPAGMDPSFQPGVLITELLDESDATWVKAYQTAMNAVEAQSSVVVRDARYMGARSEVELAVRILLATDVTSHGDAALAILHKDQSRARKAKRMRLGIAPQGVAHVEAASVVAASFNMETPPPWIRGCSDGPALQAAMKEWMLTLAGYHSHTSTAAPELRRVTALSTAMEAYGTKPFGSPDPSGGTL